MSARQATALELLAVAVGGALGTGLRYAMLDAFPNPSGRFPTTTLAVNVAGSVALGLALAYLDPRRVRRRSQPTWVRAALVAGVLGGFTTLSLVTLEIVLLADTGAASTALAYATATFLGGVLAVGTGLFVGGWRPALRLPEEDEL